MGRRVLSYRFTYSVLDRLSVGKEMKIYNSTDGTPTSTTEGLWFYNGLDGCVTLEVLEALLPQLDEITRATYERSLLLQAPILETCLRGIKIDQANVQRTAAGLMRNLAHVEEGLKEILIEGVGLDPSTVSSWKTEKGKRVEKFMWNSPLQLKQLFGGTFGVTIPKKRNAKGDYTPSLGRDELEKLLGHFHLEPIILHILAIRDINKRLGVLRSGVDSDGRMRFTLSIAGTDTGRLASYSSATGSGTNLQNITEELRSIFVADPGKKLAYIDLAQIQSRAVGAICWNLFGDSTYLDFCESGDLHTGVCMMTWQDKPWKGSGLEALTNPEYYAHNRGLANEQFYRQDSYRQGSKKLGHATNFLGQAPQVSKQTRIPADLITAFQLAYFKGFPSIKEWHAWLGKKLNKDGFITTLTGRKRWFFGRRWDPATIRQAAAYEPQDIESFINQEGMRRVWQAVHTGRLHKSVQVLVPVHDALLLQYDEEREDELIPQLLNIMRVEVPLMNGRSFIVPHDVAVGWNWQHQTPTNPDGLIGYKPPDTRTRTPVVSIMDRKFY